MYPRSIIAACMIALAAIYGRAERPSVEPPKFKLTATPPFDAAVSAKSYGPGQVTFSSPPYRFITTAAMTEHDGRGSRVGKHPRVHGWNVRVYSILSKKVAVAVTSAKDGYSLRLTEGPGVETPEEGSYMVARLRRKQFSWGHAVSFLSQFTQDMYLPAPNNTRLTYNVWGVTADRKYTVVAYVFVSHPKLPDEESDRQTLRDFRTIETLKRDPDYKLIERCKPEEFEPSLKAFDEMLDSLTIG